METLQEWFGARVPAGLPRPVRVLVRLLVTGPERRFVAGRRAGCSELRL